MIYPSRSSSCHAPFLPDIISPLVSTTSITIFPRLNCLFPTCLIASIVDIYRYDSPIYRSETRVATSRLYSRFTSFARIHNVVTLYTSLEMSFVYLIISSKRKKLETKSQCRVASYRSNSLWYYSTTCIFLRIRSGEYFR